MNSRMNTKHIVLAGLFIALGVILPQAFHVFGQASGMTFLPIHLPVMMAGLILGPVYGGVVGLLVPILSGAITGMPGAVMIPFMVCELITYGVVAGLAIRKLPVIPSVIASMLVGRLVYGLALVVGVQVIGVSYGFANVGAFLSGITTGIPGIVIQLVTLPIVYKLSRKWMN